MNSFKIEIEGQQFTNNYLVYIISIDTLAQGSFYYIGQTGDRNYLTARPAFRRLAAHFSDQGYSTENQVYRGIATKVLNIGDAKERKTFTQETKKQVALLLSTSKIQMDVFPVAKFEDESTIEKHTKNREFSEEIETELILYFLEQGKVLLNKKVPKNRIASFNLKTQEIIEEFKTSSHKNYV